NQQVDPPAGWSAVLATLLKDGDGEVQRLARRLAVHFRDAEAVRRCLAVAGDSKAPRRQRLESIRDLAVSHPPEALQPLRELLAGDADVEVRCEACRALEPYNQPDVARTVLEGWKDYPPPLRMEAINLLASRREWAGLLLEAVAQGAVARTEVTNNTVLRMH